MVEAAVDAGGCSSVVFVIVAGAAVVLVVDGVTVVSVAVGMLADAGVEEAGVAVVGTDADDAGVVVLGLADVVFEDVFASLKFFNN